MILKKAIVTECHFIASLLSRHGYQSSVVWQCQGWVSEGDRVQLEHLPILLHYSHFYISCLALINMGISM
jgi:hypothetical protein